VSGVLFLLNWAYDLSSVIQYGWSGRYLVQLSNLKEPICVRQGAMPVLGMYSVVYQKVQSSTGSTDM
jgi:hypothetical protein